MSTLFSAQPCARLRPFVRAYAQRKFFPSDLALVEPVPAQLEQVLNFELGVMPDVRHRQYRISGKMWIGGAQSSFPGHMYLWPGVESFAVFFKPTGWTRLFHTPMSEITNCIYDAELVGGKEIRQLWNRLGELPSFEQRVAVIEESLLRKLDGATVLGSITEVATTVFQHKGAVRMEDLAAGLGLSLRQFERRFNHETGVAPKIFARVARFQAALDAKLAVPERKWSDIAHSFGYYDQMHMIHDFEKLARNSPTQMIAAIGDVRPPALVAATS